MKKSSAVIVLRINRKLSPSASMIDEHGYRPNVGIVLCNSAGQVFRAMRCGGNSSQFRQGGVHHSETAQQAMYRELHEEIALLQTHVELLGHTRDWLRYDIPDEFRRRLPSSGSKVEFRGQKEL